MGAVREFHLGLDRVRIRNVYTYFILCMYKLRLTSHMVAPLINKPIGRIM